MAKLAESESSVQSSYREYRRKSNKLPRITKRERKKEGIGKDVGFALLKYVRIAPRKVKIVLDLIKDKDIDEAYAILRFTPKAASSILYKLIKSAEANAVNNNGLDRDSLFICEAFVNQGPTLKRIMPRAQGRAYRIKKKSSHITVVLKERE